MVHFLNKLLELVVVDLSSLLCIDSIHYSFDFRPRRLPVILSDYRKNIHGIVIRLQPTDDSLEDDFMDGSRHGTIHIVGPPRPPAPPVRALILMTSVTAQLGHSFKLVLQLLLLLLTVVEVGSPMCRALALAAAGR